jgi:hypothetical protein
MPEVATSLAVNTTAPTQKKRKQLHLSRAVARPLDGGGIDIKACMFKRMTVYEKHYIIYDFGTYWIQDRKHGRISQVCEDNLDGLVYSDESGQHSVMDEMHRREGKFVEQGCGARSSQRVESGGVPLDRSATAAVSGDSPESKPSRECVVRSSKWGGSKGEPLDRPAIAAVSGDSLESTLSFECVRLALALLIDQALMLRMPSACSYVRMRSVPQIFCNTTLKFTKPSKWGIPGNWRQYTGAIEAICKGATVDDRFILQVHLNLSNTSNHCVAVRGLRICDPACPELGWLPLTIASFGSLGIDEIYFGFKITGG